MKKYSNRFGFYLSIPVIVSLVLFNFWPFIETIYLSFMTQRRGELIFNGIKNYQRLFGDDIFRTALINSFIFYIIRLPIMLITCTLLVSGAAGNFIDRVRFGYVRDFIYFKLINFPVFNVADCYVTVSVVLLIILILFVYKEDDFNFLKISKKGDNNE